ncbi:MAG: hypothetical protein WBP74_05730 [Nitrososphaeraceae archaeon]
MSIGKISLEANMNEFADDQVTKTKIYIDKMNESSTMFPVIVTLNELPNQELEGVLFVSISKLDSFLRYCKFYRDTISLHLALYLTHISLHYIIIS